jgi:hypothetical protein
MRYNEMLLWKREQFNLEGKYIDKVIVSADTHKGDIVLKAYHVYEFYPIKKLASFFARESVYENKAWRDLPSELFSAKINDSSEACDFVEGVVNATRDKEFIRDTLTTRYVNTLFLQIHKAFKEAL